MARFVYRLQQLLDVKLEQKDELQQQLARRLQELAVEREVGDELQRGRVRLEQKLALAKASRLVGALGATGRAIGQQSDYVRGLTADVEEAKDAELAQQQRIRTFEDRVTAARRILAERSREVEVLNKHRDRLERRFMKEMERQEAIQQDDIVNSRFHPERQAYESLN